MHLKPVSDEVSVWKKRFISEIIKYFDRCLTAFMDEGATVAVTGYYIISCLCY